MDQRHLLCSTIYSAAFSPCGRYMAAANNFGYIFIFDFEKAISLSSSKWQKSVFTFKAHNGPIYSLISTKTHLISGGFGPVASWKWSDILERKPAMAFTLTEPSQGNEGSFASNDVNALACADKKLYAGRDDNIICIWDLSTGKCEQKLSGHKEYIHDLSAMSPSNSVVSASEDGSVKVWDLRTSQAVSTFEPHQSSNLNRPQHGKWISCVAVDEDGQWMVCGGGPKLSLWHLRSRNQAATLESADADYIPYTALFHDNIIISGGSKNFIRHWYTNGEEKASIPTAVSTVFCLAFNKLKNSSNAPLVTTGTSHKLDVFCNLSYKSHTLTL